MLWSCAPWPRLLSRRIPTRTSPVTTLASSPPTWTTCVARSATRRSSLFGGSFGSQWSLAVMCLHPESVARAVLSGVEPLNNGYDMPSHVFAALQRIAYDADRDPGLSPYLPAGGMMEAVRALHRRFAERPVQVQVRDEAGRTRTVVLGSGGFPVRAALAYAGGRAMAGFRPVALSWTLRGLGARGHRAASGEQDETDWPLGRQQSGHHRRP